MRKVSRKPTATTSDRSTTEATPDLAAIPMSGEPTASNNGNGSSAVPAAVPT
jgi:hypothetical protein